MERCNQYWLGEAAEEEAGDASDEGEDARDEGFHLLRHVPVAEFAEFEGRWKAAGLSIAEGAI